MPNGEFLSLVLLAAVLVAAVVRPHRMADAVVAVPAAAIVVALGLVSAADLRDEVSRLLPVLVFLAAILVLGYLCAAEGVFEAAGHWMARSSRGSPHRLLTQLFGLAAAVTVVLSLDATVVLLTPVVLATASRMRTPSGPHVYATGHLANSSSLLLPMANLTNLLALTASGLTLAHFAALMALPWMVVVALEYVVFRLYFRAELAEVPGRVVLHDDVEPPWFAISVLAATLAGFVATSFLDVEPYWVALAGAVVMGRHTFSRRGVTVRTVAKAVDAPFLLFVLGLAVVVRAVVDNGLGEWIDGIVPDTARLVDLLATAGIAALLANLVNNLPALLVMLPASVAVGHMAVLAVLIGVNVGPNLSYPGSLATLLWRRVLRERGVRPHLGRFTTLGVLTVPANVVLAVTALWAGQSLLGI